MYSVMTRGTRSCVYSRAPHSRESNSAASPTGSLSRENTRAATYTHNFPGEWLAKAWVNRLAALGGLCVQQHTPLYIHVYILLLLRVYSSIKKGEAHIDAKWGHMEKLTRIMHLGLHNGIY